MSGFPCICSNLRPTSTVARAVMLSILAIWKPKRAFTSTRCGGVAFSLASLTYAATSTLIMLVPGP